jgi:hypothetical protein
MIITKYEVGDRVWIADYVRVNEHIQCPDCLGVRVWAATLPNGETFNIPCPTCEHGYDGSRGYVDGPLVYGPKVWQGTIGSVGYDPHTTREDERVRYMMVETGIGSGSVYYEPRVYATEAEALTVAIVKAGEHTKQMEEAFINDLKRKKKNRPGSLISYLRNERNSLLRRITQLDIHIARISTPKTKKVE